MSPISSILTLISPACRQAGQAGFVIRKVGLNASTPLGIKSEIRNPNFEIILNIQIPNKIRKANTIEKINQPHPLMIKNKVDAIPYDHKDIDLWRNALTGGIDDVWINPAEELIIVDYKSTSKDGEIIALDQDWQDCYKRQMEIYQWLFRKNDFKVSPTGYFIYCNRDASKERFDGQLVFDITLIPHNGDDSWVEKTIIKAKKCLMSDSLPDPSPNCDYCNYRNAVKEIKT